MNEQFEKFEFNTKKKIVNFLAVGGTAAFVGLIATSEQLATNPVAQQVGLVSVVIAAMGFVGAAWQAATLDDVKNGRTIKSELADMKQDFNKAIEAFRNKFGSDEEEKEHIIPSRNRLIR